MKLGVLFSGGKDSTYALYRAMQHHEVSCLVTLLSENPESFMFHTPNINLTKVQADAMEIPLVEKTTKGVKEDELDDLAEALRFAKQEHKIEGVVTGAIGSVYQTTRIQKICDELDLWCFSPLWKFEQVEFLKEVTKEFKIIISGVAAEGFTYKWLVKELDDKAIKELVKLQESHSVNPAGEGGEIETLVLDGPIFKKRIEVKSAETEYSNFYGNYNITETELIEK